MCTILEILGLRSHVIIYIIDNSNRIWLMLT